MKFLPRVAVVLIVAALLAACAAGTNFARLSGPQLRLGQDTEASLRQRLGSPYKEGAVTKHNRQFRTLAYAYSVGGKAAVQGVTPARGQTFYFLDRVLVGHDFSSSWAEDSTNFDESRIPEIVTGQSKVAEVVGLLGEPGGEYIYPLTSKKGERAKVYSYNQVSGSVFALRILAKSLIVSYDENGVVTDLEFTKSGQD